MAERRTFERVSVGGNASLKKGEAAERHINAYLSDISFGGFAMYAPHGLNAEETVSFELTTPAMSGALHGMGKICHVEEPAETKPVNLVKVGVQFSEVNKDIVQHLINRVHLEMNNPRASRHVDFMPF